MTRAGDGVAGGFRGVEPRGYEADFARLRAGFRGVEPRGYGGFEC
jgi:hypothetical protein